MTARMTASNVAVPPPPPSKAFGYSGSGQNNDIFRRLRAVSDMQRKGNISTEEKNQIKDLLLQRNQDFAIDFDKAEATGDFSAIRSKIATVTPSMYEPQIPDMNSMSLEGDSFGTEDLSSFLDEFQGFPAPNAFASQAFPRNSISQQTQMPMSDAHRLSLGFGAEILRLGTPMNTKQEPQASESRKRQVSRSAPVQGMNKAVASQPAHAAMVRRAVDIPAGFAIPSSAAPEHSHQRSSGKGITKIKKETRGTTASTLPTKQATQVKNRPMTPDLETEESKLGQAKLRKNERERKRRLAVTQGFDELYKILQSLKEDQNCDSLLQQQVTVAAASKLDKASILKSSIHVLQALSHQVYHLKKDNERLTSLRQSRQTGA